jgi:hypothetical protein
MSSCHSMQTRSKTNNSLSSTSSFRSFLNSEEEISNGVMNMIQRALSLQITNIERAAHEELQQYNEEMTTYQEWTSRLKKRHLQRREWGQSCSSRLAQDECEKSSTKHSATTIVCEWKRPWYVVGASKCMPVHKQWDKASDLLWEFAHKPDTFHPKYEQEFSKLILPFDGFLDDILYSIDSTIENAKIEMGLEGELRADCVALLFIFCYELYNLDQQKKTMKILTLLEEDSDGILALVLAIAFSKQSFLSRMRCIQVFFDPPSDSDEDYNTSSSSSSIKKMTKQFGQSNFQKASRSFLVGLLFIAPIVVSGSGTTTVDDGTNSVVKYNDNTTIPLSLITRANKVSYVKDLKNYPSSFRSEANVEIYANQISEEFEKIEAKRQKDKGFFKSLHAIAEKIQNNDSKITGWFKKFDLYGTNLFTCTKNIVNWRRLINLRQRLPDGIHMESLDKRIKSLYIELMNTGNRDSYLLLSRDGVFEQFYNSMTEEFTFEKTSKKKKTFILSNIAKSIKTLYSKSVLITEQKEITKAAVTLAFSKQIMERVIDNPEGEIPNILLSSIKNDILKEDFGIIITELVESDEINDMIEYMNKAIADGEIRKKLNQLIKENKETKIQINKLEIENAKSEAYREASTEFSKHIAPETLKTFTGLFQSVFDSINNICYASVIVTICYVISKFCNNNRAAAVARDETRNSNVKPKKISASTSDQKEEWDSFESALKRCAVGKELLPCAETLDKKGISFYLKPFTYNLFMSAYNINVIHHNISMYRQKAVLSYFILKNPNEFQHFKNLINPDEFQHFKKLLF